MLSRVASHLYWLSRYLERAENMARILDVGASLALLSGAGDERAASEPLIITDTLESFGATGRPLTPEDVARYLAWSPDNPSSIVNCLEASRENARAVRPAALSATSPRSSVKTHSALSYSLPHGDRSFTPR